MLDLPELADILRRHQKLDMEVDPSRVAVSAGERLPTLSCKLAYMWDLQNLSRDPEWPP